jgi:hypothetical protein
MSQLIDLCTSACLKQEDTEDENATKSVAQETIYDVRNSETKISSTPSNAQLI